MSAKITSFKNPLTASSGNMLDWSTWLGGILWVIMLGVVMSVGVKAYSAIDKRVPGDNTPNLRMYQTPEKASQLQIL